MRAELKRTMKTYSLIGLLVCLLTPAFAMAQTVRLSVRPSLTDPQIDTFDDDHTLYSNPTVKSRHQLLVFLPGTNGKTRNTGQFSTLAADLGYQVICLMYPDTLSATACWDDKDREAFAKFRQEIIEGQDISPYITVNRANSVENRLIKLLLYLKKTRPSEDWGQYLDSKNEPVWEKIALAGQSQGGGHAAIIACRHRVARVLCFSSPKDFSRRYNQPAAWYAPSLTPTSHYFVFVHEQDKQGCSYPQQLDILKAMGLYQLGAPKSVDNGGISASDRTHILTTNYPGTLVSSRTAHTSVVSDGGSPKDKSGAALFRPIWTYMLTAD